MSEERIVTVITQVREVGGRRCDHCHTWVNRHFRGEHVARSLCGVNCGAHMTVSDWDLVSCKGCLAKRKCSESVHYCRCGQVETQTEAAS